MELATGGFSTTPRDADTQRPTPRQGARRVARAQRPSPCRQSPRSKKISKMTEPTTTFARFCKFKTTVGRGSKGSELGIFVRPIAAAIQFLSLQAGRKLSRPCVQPKPTRGTSSAALRSANIRQLFQKALQRQS